MKVIATSVRPKKRSNSRSSVACKGKGDPPGLKSRPAISRKPLIRPAITNSVFYQAKCLGRSNDVNFPTICNSAQETMRGLPKVGSRTR